MFNILYTYTHIVEKNIHILTPNLYRQKSNFKFVLENLIYLSTGIKKIWPNLKSV